MDLLDLIESKRFLGNEFLLWLWYESERTDGVFELDDGGVELIFDDQLVLEAQLAEAEQSRLKGGAPAYAPEARLALQQGKRVTKAKLRMIKDAREWVFTADAPTFRFSGIKLPALLTSEDDERFYERMYLIEELESAWDELYRRFLEIRLSDDWQDVRVRMADWIAQPLEEL